MSEESQALASVLFEFTRTLATVGQSEQLDKLYQEAREDPDTPAPVLKIIDGFRTILDAARQL